MRVLSSLLGRPASREDDCHDVTRPLRRRRRRVGLWSWRQDLQNDHFPIILRIRSLERFEGSSRFWDMVLPVLHEDFENLGCYCTKYCKAFDDTLQYFLWSGDDFWLLWWFLAHKIITHNTSNVPVTIGTFYRALKCVPEPPRLFIEICTGNIYIIKKQDYIGEYWRSRIVPLYGRQIATKRPDRYSSFTRLS